MKTTDNNFLKNSKYEFELRTEVTTEDITKYLGEQEKPQETAQCPSCGSYNTKESYMMEEGKKYPVRACKGCGWWE